MDEPTLARGFDRGMDYAVLRDKFIAEVERIYNCIRAIKEEDADKFYKKKNMLLKKLIYLIISSIQLRNGSRISESIQAFKTFLRIEKYTDKVVVKIAKSDSLKINKKGKQFRLKPRFRKMMFPKKWIPPKLMDIVRNTDALKEVLNCGRVRLRLCDYLNKNFNCNTHSLRYACINYLLYDKKLEMGIVAKFVGHSSLDQLVRYTQLKNLDAIFDMDI